MKSISNYDFSLLLEKLPMVLRYARGCIPPTDIKAVNSLRVLILLHKKLLRANERRAELARTIPSAAEVAHKAKLSKQKPNKNDKE